MVYFLATLAILLKVLTTAAAECQEVGFQRMDICRQSNEEFKFTKGIIHFHTDGLDFEFSLCACQVTSDTDVSSIDIHTRYYPSETHPFDVHIISRSNVSHISGQKPLTTYMYGSLPLELVIGKKNVSRDISLEDRVDYCIILNSDATKNLTMRCTTIKDESNFTDNVSAPILISCLLASAVVGLAIGLTCGYCCRPKSAVHRLRGETPCQDFGDSGIASDGHLYCNGQEWGVESDYASVDVVETFNEKGEIIIRKSAREKHDSVIMVDNVLYS